MGVPDVGVHGSNSAGSNGLFLIISSPVILDLCRVKDSWPIPDRLLFRSLPTANWNKSRELSTAKRALARKGGLKF